MSAPSSARSRLALDERRAQLLALGSRLFAERAYDDVSIDDIAEAAGVSKGLLYHYFGGKRDFYVATVRDAAAQLQLRTEPDLALPPAERARAGIEGYLSFVDEHAAPFVSLMRSGIGNDPEVASIVDRTRDAIVARVVRDLGLASPRPVFRVALRGWIGMVEAASLDWLERREIARDALVQLLLESLYAALVFAVRADPEAGVELAAPGASTSSAAGGDAGRRRP